jgi:hypothetical protein
VALTAVGRWLTSQFPEQVIQPVADEEIDFSIATTDGRKLGVIVKTLQNPLLWKQQVMRMVDRSKERTTATFSELWICLVTDGRESAAALGAYLTRRSESPSNYQLCIGWLDANATFVVEFQFPIS